MDQPRHLDVTPAELQIIQALLSKHLPQVVVWAYGSRVKGSARRTSDLDIVVFANPQQKSHVGDLIEALEESDLPYPVAVQIWDDSPENFREHMLAANIQISPQVPVQQR